MNFSLFGDDPPDTPEGIAPPELSSASLLSGGEAPSKDLPTLIGHDGPRADLWAAFRSGRFPHGIILSGPEGIGKALMAKHIAAFLLGDPDNTQTAETPFATTQAARAKIALMSHPDLLVVSKLFDDDKGRLKANLLVDQLRPVPSFLQKTASITDGWRVVIIDDADTMNRNAQNALLKILEEPPPKTLLILVAHRSGAFLPTVRSRCRIVPLTALPDPLFRQVLRAQAIDRSPLLATLFPGMPGQVAAHLENGSEPVWTLLEELCQAWPTLDPVAVHLMAERLAPADQDAAFRFFLFILTGGCDHLIRARATGQSPCEPWRSHPLWSAVAPNASVTALFTLRDRIEDYGRRVLDQSLDRKTAILQIFVLLKQG